MTNPNLPLITSKDELPLDKMREYAARLASGTRKGDMLTLRGDLGAGKTTFAQAFIEALSTQAVEVTSPTFNIMQSYDVLLPASGKDTLWHLDLYRLDDACETRALGLPELEEHVMLIEWPEIIEHELPMTRLDVYLRFSPDMQSRTLAFHGNGAWRERLASLW